MIPRVHVTGRQEDQNEEARVQSKWAPLEAGGGAGGVPEELH